MTHFERLLIFGCDLYLVIPYITEELSSPAPISMQEIKKRRIVIASVLKPVDDARMMEKIGQSLAARFEVHIIGFPTSSSESTTDLVLHPIYRRPFKRLSVKRLCATFSFFRIALSLRPDVVIICTHELLVASMVLRLLQGGRIFYDVQENYFRNVLFTKAFPKILRPFIAGYVRLKEWVTSPFVSQFLLAEASYQEELPFLGARFTVIENKFKVPSGVTIKRSERAPGLKLLFSGTLAESTGIFDAIDLAVGLHEVDPSVSLTIAGYAARASDYDRIIRAVKGKPYISLLGGNLLLPHHDIVKQIVTADFGIIAYPPNPSTEGSLPTKLFEYLALNLPILMVHKHQRWTQLCELYSAAIVLDSANADPHQLLSEMKSKSFYTSKPGNVTWDSEEKKLLALF